MSNYTHVVQKKKDIPVTYIVCCKLQIIILHHIYTCNKVFCKILCLYEEIILNSAFADKVLLMHGQT